MAGTSNAGRKTIEVTAEIIEQSQRANSNHCMIADAIKAFLPEVTGVAVDLQTIRFTDREKGQRYIYFTPFSCQEQLLRFDQGVELSPWSFRLPYRPAQVVKVVAKPDRPNKVGRPIASGPKKITGLGPKNVVDPESKDETRPRGVDLPVVEGGQSPPTAVLSNARGRRRVFGIRAARGFDPSQAARPDDEPKGA